MKVKELITELNNLSEEQKDLEVTFYDGDYGIYSKIFELKEKNGYKEYFGNGEECVRYYGESPFNAPLAKANPDIDPIGLIVIYG